MKAQVKIKKSRLLGLTGKIVSTENINHEFCPAVYSNRKELFETQQLAEGQTWDAEYETFTRNGQTCLNVKLISIAKAAI